MAEGQRLVNQDQNLLEAHVDALFVHNRHGRITTTNEPPPDRRPAPRFYLGRGRASGLWRVRDDVSPSTGAELAELATSEITSGEFSQAPRNSERMAGVLRTARAIDRSYFGPAFRFPTRLPESPDVTTIRRTNTELLGPNFAWLSSQVEPSGPCLAIVVDGVAVAACWSSRVGERAAEAGVETVAEHRGKGYATRLVAAWASEVRRLGCTPLYSTGWDNAASRRVAEHLGLVMCGTDFHIT